MSSKPITVMTPTFNRGNLLVNLYESLKAQTDKNFIWSIIDDGSSDDTRNIVKAFIEEGLIKIEYTYQENAGKYVAHNSGVRRCNTELIVCVDSDDSLYPFAIEKTLSHWEKVKSDKAIAGIVSPRDMNGHAYMKYPPSSDTLMNLYISGSLVGETMLVFRTDVLSEYMFPEIPGEKFMSECVIYNQIDQRYKLSVQNEFLCKSEYQPDGLTRNIMKVHFKNPKSTLLMHKSVAAFHADKLTAAKAYGAYLAWKKIWNMDKSDLYRVKWYIRIAGALLMLHYARLFRKQMKNFLNEETV